MHTSRGFTTIEALVAGVLILVAVLELAGIAPDPRQLAIVATQETEAAAAAQQYVDSLGTHIRSSGGNHDLPVATFAAAGGFTLSNNGCPMTKEVPGLYECAGTATWTYDGATHAVTVKAFVSASQLRAATQPD